MKKLLPLALVLALGACGHWQPNPDHACCCPYSWMTDSNFASKRGLQNAPVEFNDRVMDGHYYDVPGACPNGESKGKGGMMKHHHHHHAAAAAPAKADAKADKKDSGNKTK